MVLYPTDTAWSLYWPETEKVRYSLKTALVSKLILINKLTHHSKAKSFNFKTRNGLKDFCSKIKKIMFNSPRDKYIGLWNLGFDSMVHLVQVSLFLHSLVAWLLPICPTLQVLMWQLVWWCTLYVVKTFSYIPFEFIVIHARTGFSKGVHTLLQAWTLKLASKNIPGKPGSSKSI